MACMGRKERLEVKEGLNRVMRASSNSNHRTFLENLGIYCSASESFTLDFDALDDSTLIQLRKELQNFLGSKVEDSVDQVLSRKALRATILKIRFAKTISKATNGEKSISGQQKEKPKRRREDVEEIELKRRRRQVNINREREARKEVEERKIREEIELKRRRRQENINKEREARKEVEERKIREEIELKRRRQENINREREASRKALELMEKNVVVEENFKVMKELDMLIHGGPGPVPEFNGIDDSTLLRLRKEIRDFVASNTSDGKQNLNKERSNTDDHDEANGERCDSNQEKEILKRWRPEEEETMEMINMRHENEWKRMRQELINRQRAEARKALELMKKNVVEDDFDAELWMLMNGHSVC